MVLLVVDVQNGVTNEALYAYEKVRKNIRKLIDKARERNIEVIFTQHEDGLLKYLKEKKETQVMIAGMQTDYSIDATIKSGFEHGFEMLVPEYTNSTFDNPYFSKKTAYHYFNEFLWPGRYAECVTMEEAFKRMEAASFLYKR